MNISQGMLKLVSYDMEYLAKSYDWLNDGEIRRLIDGPQIVTYEQQLKWYSQILLDPTYLIWGVEYNGIAIGACGLKHVDFEKKSGEYWGYIGEKSYWGGKGHSLLSLIYRKARDYQLDKIDLVVSSFNTRAYKLYITEGFSVTKYEGNKIYMSKKI